MPNLRLPDGRAVRCPQPHSAAVLWQEVSSGLYAEAIDKLSASDGAVVDIGANIGLASLFFRDRVPHVRVLALEPAADCFACLEANLARHAPDAVALPIAVGGRSGLRDFVYYPNAPEQSTLHVDADDTRATVATVLARSGMTRLMRESMIEVMFGGSTRSSVPVRTLSEVLADNGVDDVALLKIDVERAELEVLYGVDDRDWARIRRVVVEVHDLDGRLAAAVALLRGQGYAVDVEQSHLFTGTNVFGVLGRRD